MSGTASPARPTDDELRARLEGELGARVVGLERRPHPYQTSFPLEELRVELDDGRSLALVFKDVASGSLPLEVALAKPSFLYDPLREIETYRSILARLDLGTPAFYGALVEPERDRFWLFIERVDAIALWQEGDFEAWEETARWLARLHERARARERTHLLSRDRAFLALWLERAKAILGSRLARRVATAHSRAVDRLARLPETFIHGEFYPSNVLVQRRAGNVRIAPVDWEMAGVGPAALDVAALVGGRWSPPEADALVEAYLSALTAPPPGDDFRRDLDCARLCLAVQWLGWSPAWRPPPESAHDWLAEALALAEGRCREGG